MADLFDIQLLHMTLRTVVPVLLAALGGALCERAGLFNVALEGMMLAGAFGAVVGSFFLGGAGWGVLAAIAAATAIGLILAVLSLNLRANEIVVGISLNLLVVGLTTFLMRVVLGATGTFHHPDLQGLPSGRRSGCRRSRCWAGCSAAIPPWSGRPTSPSPSSPISSSRPPSGCGCAPSASTPPRRRPWP